MMDWITIVAACGLTAVVGLGFVLWERYEDERLARERPRRSPRRSARRRAVSDIDRRAA